MLYHLLVPLADTISALNVFRYLTFRSIGAALTALMLSFVIAPLLIRLLEDRQIGQTVREDTPERHQAKTGTPTMGGVLILFALVTSTLLWSEWTNPYVWCVVGVTLGCGAIGFVDDYQKAILKNPQGISARAKLAGQFGVAIAGAIGIYLVPGFDAQISLPLVKGFHPDIGIAYVPLMVLFIVGFSNAVNLTDGLDGLAIGPSLVTAGVIGVFTYAAGNSIVADYLELKYVPGAGTLAIFCAALMGAGLGFLWFNTYPASVFMGDTGALALGGAFGTIAIIIRQEVVLVIAGGIFMVEMFSVIAQVVSFKATGRRIFRMAPIHHHYELKGWPEPQIIVRFWIISFILALLALSLLKLR
ncbi:MAG: phospho-N-acetylmuramoyl-pentapeptide-transferase [Deltaproteobacteria bacterium]|nr:phospho-N-acetylmuramoyl-pentapeptide-transferase [Deltaproteobacteria bacterium]MBW2413395.1 phospho-N-acetylmuramoyl-pentapeptide-transferase [Deltaproteobacteria bacterium]